MKTLMTILTLLLCVKMLFSQELMVAFAAN